MNEQGENTKSRREVLKGLTGFAYAAPVIAVLTANKKADAANPQPAQRRRMRMRMHGHGGHG
jgi:hypothetical protein